MRTDVNLARRTSHAALGLDIRPAIVERALAAVLASPAIRQEAVARARRLLASPCWCKAEEVAAELVRCYAGRLLP